MAVENRTRLRAVGVYQVVVGVVVFAWWAIALAGGSVPEIEAGDPGISFHLAAEGLMAVLLIVGGMLIYQTPSRQALVVSAVALGSLLYSAVNSAGYFAETGEWPMLGFFGVLVVLTVASGISLGAQQSKSRDARSRT